MSGKKGQKKTLEEELIERSNEKVQAHAASIGGKVLDREIDENLETFESKSGVHIEGFKANLQYGISKYNLNLHSTVFFLLSVQLLISFFLLLFLYIFSFVLALILIWIVMFVGVIYCISYCLISRFPHRFKKSSTCFFMCMLLAICEGIVLCCISMPISSKVFLIEVSMIIIALFSTCIFAKLKKENYSAKSGLILTLSVTVAFYLIFMVSVEDIRIWLSVCTILVCGYEYFLVNKVSEVIKKMQQEEGEDNFQGGLYASLLIFKSKIDFFAVILSKVYEKCCKPKPEPEQTSTEL